MQYCRTCKFIVYDSYALCPFCKGFLTTDVPEDTKNLAKEIYTNFEMCHNNIRKLSDLINAEQNRLGDSIRNLRKSIDDINMSNEKGDN